MGSLTSIPFTMCMKFNNEAYKLIFNFCDATPLIIIQSTIFFRMYLRFSELVFGANGRLDEPLKLLILSCAALPINEVDVAETDVALGSKFLLFLYQ